MSPLSPLPGAVPIEEGQDLPTGAVAHYGSPSREERAIGRGEAYTDLSHLDIIEVHGPDRLDWLNSLTSQRLLDLQPGDSTETLSLDPTGHIEHAAGVIDDGTSTWLMLDSGCGRPFADYLTSMKFMKQVDVKLREDVGAVGAHVRASVALAAVAVSGGESGSIPLIWHDPWPVTGPGGATYGPVDEEHPGVELRTCIALVALDAGAESDQRIAGREQVRGKLRQDTLDHLAEAGLAPAGLLAWEALRITSWRPRFGAEVIERSMPHEYDWLRSAVHLKKGCYRGQEAVAKIVNMGKPPRRLTMLYLEGPVDELPRRGDDVVHDGTVVGTITSAIRAGVDGPVALALLRRSTPADAVLEVGAFHAGQQTIVTPTGKSSASPATRPGAEFRRRLM